MPGTSASAVAAVAVLLALLGCSSSPPPTPMHGVIKGREASSTQACLWSGPDFNGGVVATFLFGDAYPAPPPWPQDQSTKWNRGGLTSLNVTMRFPNLTAPLNGSHRVDGSSVTAQFIAMDPTCEPAVNESAISGQFVLDAISGAEGSDATGSLHLVFADGTIDGSFTAHVYCEFDPAAVDPACKP